MKQYDSYELRQPSCHGQKNNPLLRLEVADTFWRRFCGLMGRRRPEADGLLLSPCNSVHMCFMRFALDIVYLDAQGKIIKLVPDLRPWLGLSACLRAQAVIELPAGGIERWGLVEGDLLNRSTDCQQAVEQKA